MRNKRLTFIIKVDIIGSGAVGKALAKGFLDQGYPTTIARSADTRRRRTTMFICGNQEEVGRPMIRRLAWSG